MKIQIFQNIIDIIRCKKNKLLYEELKNTCLYLKGHCRLENQILNDIIKSNTWIFYKRDKQKLQKFLNTIAASSIPKANGKLREYQLRLLELAKTLNNELENIGLHPMLTGGSLIGALRHNDFVPWDDDLDFDLMRDEYNRMCAYVKKNHIFMDSYKLNFEDFLPTLDDYLKNNPNKVIFCESTICLSAYIGTSLEDVIVIDFFPREYMNPNITLKEYTKYKLEKTKLYNIAISHHPNYKTALDFFKNELSNPNIYVKRSNLTAYGWGNVSFERDNKLSLLYIDNILPAKRIHFGNYDFYTYNNPDYYLKDYYGDYMKIPYNIEIAKYLKWFSQYLKDNNRSYYIDYEKIKNGDF